MLNHSLSGIERFGVWWEPSDKQYIASYRAIGKKSGGMGEVYLVESPEFGLLVAKTSRDDRNKQTISTELFRLEASVWLDLDEHPNIVKASFVDEADRKPFLFMEYVPGPSLQDILQALKGKPLPLDRAIDYAIQFSHGMEHVHDKNVIHGDIKPANCLVSRVDDLVRITDFGISRILQRYTYGRKNNPGTLPYMAPEQFYGNVDQHSDIYSFGVMFFQMLTGRFPFDETLIKEGSDMRQTLYQLHRTYPRHPPSDFYSRVPLVLDQLVLDCLQISYTARPSGFTEIKTRLMEGYKAVTERSYRRIEEIEHIGVRITWNNKGVAFLQLKQYARALECLQEAEEVYGEDADVYANMSLAYEGLGDWDKALEYCKRALEMEPERQGALSIKQRLLFRLGRSEESVQILDDLLRLDPQNLRAIRAKVGILLEMDKETGAAKAAELALQVKTSDAEALNQVGEILGLVGRITEAEEYFSKVLMQLPDDPYALVGKGVCHKQRHELSQALACFKRASMQNPRLFSAWYHQGDCLHRMGHKHEALTFFSHALSCASVDPEEKYAVSAALFCARELINRSRSSGNVAEEAFALETIGRIFFRIGDYPAGFACLIQALGHFKRIDEQCYRIVYNEVLTTRGRLGQLDPDLPDPGGRIKQVREYAASQSRLLGPLFGEQLAEGVMDAGYFQMAPILQQLFEIDSWLSPGELRDVWNEILG